MAQLDVYANDNPGSRTAIPFLLDVQADFLSSLGTRVVVPLYRLDQAPARSITHLTPRLEFEANTYVAMVPELAGIPRRTLGPLAGNVNTHRAVLLAALDFLLTGG